MLSRAGVNDNVKSILVFTFKAAYVSSAKLLSLPCTCHTRNNNRIPWSPTILCVCMLQWISQVSFRAHWLDSFCPSCPVLFLLSLSCSFSFLPSLSFLLSPSFNKIFVGRLTQKESSLPALTVRILRSWDLARICISANYLSVIWDLPLSNMLEAAISVSCFCSTSQTRLCALRMSRYVVSITFTKIDRLICDMPFLGYLIHHTKEIGFKTFFFHLVTHIAWWRSKNENI